MVDKRIAMTGKSGAAKIGSDLDRLKAVGDDEGSCEGHVPKKITGDGVTAMMGRLKLTTKEAKTFVLDDSSQDAFKDPKWAIMHKIMAPNTYHIQTITSVVTLAWGNPRSLKVTSMGPNMFLAEFPSKIDMQHVLNGSPWVMGKNAILLKEFDPRIQPADVVFDRLLLWVRIYKLSYPLMNTDRGRALAGTIGDVVRVEADENGRAWEEFMCVRINVDILEPLMCWVVVDLASKKETTYYEVKYEKLPMFCFSCGLVGHSSVACPTPASRDEAHQLPWCSDRVCVQEVRWKDQRSSSGHGVQLGQGSSNRPPTTKKKQVEVTSPVKPR
jgi:hypothetical protein